MAILLFYSHGTNAMGCYCTSTSVNCISGKELNYPKCGSQVCFAIVINITMHLPYYFQYYTTECSDASCECPNGNISDINFPLDFSRIGYFSSVERNKISNTGNESKYWTHCWSDFMNSIGWDIWYAAYQVCFEEYNELNLKNVSNQNYYIIKHSINPSLLFSGDYKINTNCNYINSEFSYVSPTSNSLEAKEGIEENN